MRCGLPIGQGGLALGPVADLQKGWMFDIRVIFFGRLYKVDSIFDNFD